MPSAKSARLIPNFRDGCSLSSRERGRAFSRPYGMGGRGRAGGAIECVKRKRGNIFRGCGTRSFREEKTFTFARFYILHLT